jgi:hypothetical protein
MCFVWLVGFELGPWLHIALHEYLPHHHHTALGEIVDDHDRDGEVDEHAADAAEDQAEHEDRAHQLTHAEKQLASALQHGAHSIEHHGVAVPPPAPPVLHPLPIDRRPILEVAAIEIDPIERPVARAVARGPPESLALQS